MKKVLIIAGIGAAILFFMNQKDADPEQQNQIVGFRELTDAEAQNYLSQNVDLLSAFGKDLERAKKHWRDFGYQNEFLLGTRQNPYLT